MQTPPAAQHDTGLPSAPAGRILSWRKHAAQPGRRPLIVTFALSSLLFFALLGVGLVYRLVHDGRAPGISLNYLGAADRLMEQRDFRLAMQQYRIAVGIAPDDSQAWLRLGVAARAAGEADEAIAAFSTLLRIEPRHAMAHQMLGALYLERDQLDEAIRHSRLAIRLRPRLAEAYSNLGAALLRKGATEEAIANYRRALRIDPSLAHARMRLAALGVAPEGE